MDSKPFWQSKTIWVNLIAVAVLIAISFGVDLSAEQTASITAGALGVINIILRAITNKPITW